MQVENIKNLYLSVKFSILSGVIERRDSMQTSRTGTPINPRIGERIQTARRRRRWTQQELAKRAGVSFVVISRLETGRQSVSAERLAAIARVLRLSLDEVCREDDTLNTKDEEKDGVKLSSVGVA
jgi:ribosome-binding protein aMBF1 (putative translation factor)